VFVCAQSIGGSVCTASGSQLLAGAVGGFIGGSLGSMRMTSKGLSAGKRALGSLAGLSKGLNTAGEYVGEKAKGVGSSMVNGIRSRLRGG